MTNSRRLTQWCPKCQQLVDTQQELTWRAGMLIEDRSQCPECGRLLWLWKYDVEAPRRQYPPDKVQLTLF